MIQEQKRMKQRLERLLRRHRYRQDTRPDHREWGRYGPAFHTHIRLDRNNPDGLNGFELTITTYTRWAMTLRKLDALLGFLKKEFS